MTFATNYLGKSAAQESCSGDLFSDISNLGESWSVWWSCLFSGHFLLTKLLLNKMVETAHATGVQGRIVNVSSTIHGWFSGDIIRYLGLITRDKR